MVRPLLTPRLELRPGSRLMLEADLVGPLPLAGALDADVPAGWPPDLFDADAIRYMLDRLGKERDADPWGFYYILLRADSPAGATRPTLIGAGGYKGPPDANGRVEIGYSILEDYHRRGYATEALQGWVAHAWAEDRVQVVVGQTLLGHAASIGVLEKTGFRYAGPGLDEDAPPGEQVIRYELARRSAHD